MARKAEPVNFEGALRELEALVEKMETGDLSLEESLKHFERGVGLSRACQKALTAAEQKVKILMEKDHAHALEEFVPETDEPRE